jgi:site-specific DNA recombinase
MKFKIAFYIRCSKEEQGLHANPEGTIKNQKARLRYEVDAKNRSHDFGEVVGIFVEDGVSAKDTKRPELQRLLKAIECHEINLVMVTEFSRLSRNMRDFASMWELFKRSKCSVISLRESFDTSTAAGEMMLYNMANLAQYERRMTSERVIASRIDRARRGLYNGGFIPLGYKRGARAGYLEVNPDEAEVVQMIFKKFLDIGTLLRTAKWLNEHKIYPALEIECSPRLRLGHFTVGKLRYILTNITYVGICRFVHQGKLIESKALWPEIISLKDFSKVQMMLKENFRKKKSHSTSRYPYTLSGLVYCKCCGEVMCGKSAHGNTTKVGYYEHSWSVRKNASLVEKSFKCEMPKRVNAKVVEKFVHDIVTDLIINEHQAQSLLHEAHSIFQNESDDLMRAKKLKEESSSISLQLQGLTQRLATLPQDVPADEIYKAIKLLHQKRDQIKMELEKNQNEVLGQDRPVDDSHYLEYLRGLKTSWMTALDNPEAKEKIIKSLIARMPTALAGDRLECKLPKFH